MKLPEPARTVWRAHRHAIERIAAEPGGESRVLLGGGSVLAARWEHRRSTDIDILVPERHTLNDAAPGGPVDLASATGGTEPEVLPRQIRVTVGEGKIDIAAITPELAGLEHNEDVDGRQTLVLASEQILRGKLNRTDEVLARDALDIAVAARAEPRALELAINSVSERTERIAEYNLEIGNDDMVRGSAETLLGVPPKYKDLVRRPGEAASDAMRACRYTDVTIRMQDGAIEIGTRTRRGTTRVERYDPADAAAALRKSGMREYLENNTRTLPAAVSNELDRLRRDDRNGTAFTAGDGDRPIRAAAGRPIREDSTTPGGPGDTGFDEPPPPATGPSPATGASKAADAKRDSVKRPR